MIISNSSGEIARGGKISSEFPVRDIVSLVLVNEAGK